MKKYRRMSTRERRERYMRSMSLTHLLIAVVALIECLLLVTFTTYSWIESSSSLIIASGEGGLQPMAIAKALDCRVNIEQDPNGTTGVINLGGLTDTDENSNTYFTGEDRYFVDTRYFSYSKASSSDGKTFFFPYTNLAGDEVTRAGDTTDYNINYTYIDFILSNTGTEKSVFFLSDNVFIYAGGSASSEVQDYILDAMRISIQKNSEAPHIFSNDGDDITALNGGAQNTDPISSYSFPSGSDPNSASPVFFSSSGTVDAPTQDKISVRVWFEWAAVASENKTAVTNALGSSVIGLNFSLMFANIFYDTVTFDDYAFSVFEGKEGVHVTDEASDYGYSMYFHAYDTSVGDYVNFSMTKAAVQPADGASRWEVRLAIPYVLDLLKESGVYYNGAYFFYGKAGSTGAPTAAVYKWDMTDIGNFAIVTTNIAGTLNTQLSDNTKVIRNLGVVKSESQQNNYNLGIGGAIDGWAEFVTSSSEALTMINLRDQATGYTGGDYNLTASGYDPYQYITSKAADGHTVAIWKKSDTQAVDPNFDGLYYMDVPKSMNDHPLTRLIFNNGYTGGGNQTTDVLTSSYSSVDDLDGKCFCANGWSYGHLNAVEYVDTTGLMPITKINDNDYVRVYFYNNAGKYHDGGWADVHLYTVYTSEAHGEWSAIMNYVGSTFGFKAQYDHLYINRVADSAAASTTSADTAKESIHLYYDTTAHLYKALVPSSWITSSGTYLHYNVGNYYDDASDKIRFNIGVGALTGGDYIYTMLGYSDQQSLSAMGTDVTVNEVETHIATGTGLGTWEAVREVRFATELIDTQIFADYAYKLSYSDGSAFAEYPMAPVDSLGLTFKAYLPSSVCSIDRRVRFLRYSAYDSASAATGAWYSHAFTAADTTYYAVDPTATNGSGMDTAVRGYFHVAVLTDATYENLIYDILHTDHPAGAYLMYSIDNASPVSMADVVSGACVDRVNSDGLPYLAAGSTRRWIIPITANTTTVYYGWQPYDSTNFIYTHNIADGIYFTVSEGF